jgi:hypothetical protein
VSEHGNLLVCEGAFHAILIVAEAIIFLLFVCVDVIMMEVTGMLNILRVMSWEEIGCEVFYAGTAKVRIVERIELCLATC